MRSCASTLLPLLIAGSALACSHRVPARGEGGPETGAEAGLAIVGGKVHVGDGALVARTVHVAGGTIRAVDELPPRPGEVVVDATGGTIVPAFIDAHVHLSFASAGAELAGGVVAAVDLGAPVEWLDAVATLRPLRVLGSGPLVTARGGYPTRGWGQDGFGLEIAGIDEARAAVVTLGGHGARLIKVAIEPGGGPVLSAAELSAVVGAAHQRRMRVAAHALDEASVRAALTAGVDLLAHTPLAPISGELTRAFCARPGAAFVSTLLAFGNRPATRDNARRLREAGCQVLYGTDLGNGIGPGIQPGELAALRDIGLSSSQAIEAATRAPADYFGLGDLGAIAPGRAASLVIVDGDAHADPDAFASLRAVVVEGAVRGGALDSPPPRQRGRRSTRSAP